MASWPARIALAALTCTVVIGAAPSADRVLIASPDSTVVIGLQVTEGRLFYDVRRGGAPVIESSRFSILVAGLDLGDGVTLGAIENYRVDEAPRAHGARITVIHRTRGLRYGVEMRAYDDGAALRALLPGQRSPPADAASTATLPSGATLLSGLPMTAKLPREGGYVAIRETNEWRVVSVAADVERLFSNDILDSLRAAR